MPGRDSWLLVRRSLTKPHECAYFLSNAPPDTALLTLAQVASTRYTIEQCFEEAKGVDKEMDLAAESAPAPTQALFVLRAPFFEPPAAYIWARTAVLSGMTAAMSGSWANCLNMSAQIPFSSQRA